MFTYILLYFACFPYHSKQQNSYCAVHCTLVNSQKWVPRLPLFLMCCRPSEVRTPSELWIEFSQLSCKPLSGVSFPVQQPSRVVCSLLVFCLWPHDAWLLTNNHFLDIVAVPQATEIILGQRHSCCFTWESGVSVVQPPPFSTVQTVGIQCHRSSRWALG